MFCSQHKSELTTTTVMSKSVFTIVRVSLTNVQYTTAARAVSQKSYKQL